jgi:sterol 3beta-glucosyltransferase
LNTQIFWHGGKIGLKRLRKASPEVFNLELHWPFHPDENRLKTPLLLACSPTVVPRPDDWSATHIPGYFFLESPPSYQPPEALADFLSAGEPPVCVSFGSMIHREAERIYRVICDALSKTGTRAVVIRGWNNLSCEQFAGILMLDDIPHDWLFPRCKAVIHHGGAGATAGGLRAGIPSYEFLTKRADFA